MEMICRFYPIAYYIYLFDQCLVGFGYFSVVKTFKITEIIWRSDVDMYYVRQQNQIKACNSP